MRKPKNQHKNDTYASLELTEYNIADRRGVVLEQNPVGGTDDHRGLHQHFPETYVLEDEFDYEDDAEEIDFERALEKRWKQRRCRKHALCFLGLAVTCLSLLAVSAMYTSSKRSATTNNDNQRPQQKPSGSVGGGGASSSSSSPSNNLLLLNKQRWKPMRTNSICTSPSELPTTTTAAPPKNRNATTTARSSRSTNSISSLSMSDDGQILAIGYNIISSSSSSSSSTVAASWCVMKYHEEGASSNGSWAMAASDFAPRKPAEQEDSSSSSSSLKRNNVVAQVQLSGDGTTLIAGTMVVAATVDGDNNNNTGSNKPYFLQLLAQVIQSKDSTHWNNYSYDKPLDMIGRDSDSDGFVPTDFAVNKNGTICAIGYGTNRTTTSTSCTGNNDHDCVTDTNFRTVGTYILPCNAGSWNYSNNNVYRFVNEYESDNFGFNVDMSSNGGRTIQSTEHNINDHYRVSNLISYSANDQAYYATTDALMLDKDYDLALCQEDINDGEDQKHQHQQVVRSDVAISDDGDVAVVAVQCWNGTRNHYTVHTFVADQTAADGFDPTWTKIDQLAVRDGGSVAGESFSLSLSGDAKTLVLVRGGNKLELYEWHENNKAWRVLEKIIQQQQSVSGDVSETVVVEDDAKIAVALCRDGSRIAVATNYNQDNSFTIYQRM